MGNVMGKLDFRVHNGAVQFTQDNGATWSSVGGANVDPPYILGSNVQNYDIPGLSGDTDGDYILSGRILLANGISPTILLQPNQISASQDSLIQTTAAAGAPATARVANLMIDSFATDAAGAPFIWFIARLTAKTGQVRRFLCDGSGLTGSSTNVRHMMATRGEWSDTSTVITNFRIASSVAASMLAGSFFVLQRTGINT